jgi:hypothetical protein
MRPIEDLVFTGELHRITCVNHPTAEYLWKGPGRHLHFVRAAVEFRRTPDGNWGAECPCPFSDLRLLS